MDYTEFHLKFNTAFRLRMSKEDIQILGQIEREFIEANIKSEPISNVLYDRIFDLWAKYATLDEARNEFMSIDFSKFNK